MKLFGLPYFPTSGHTGHYIQGLALTLCQHQFSTQLGHHNNFEETFCDKTGNLVADIKDWYGSVEGNREAVSALSKFITESLIPDLDVVSVHGGSCVTSDVNVWLFTCFFIRVVAVALLLTVLLLHHPKIPFDLIKTSFVLRHSFHFIIEVIARCFKILFPYLLYLITLLDGTVIVWMTSCLTGLDAGALLTLKLSTD